MIRAGASPAWIAKTFAAPYNRASIMARRVFMEADERRNV